MSQTDHEAVADVELVSQHWSGHMLAIHIHRVVLAAYTSTHIHTLVD